eukprot:TRINITY_DN2041_c0_g1_i1.p1 TRINITY_DN2041_c0_g1~~TRINITY_DN2041_c0_g1_i1.p1  ORF type:complete len:1043 (+),score=436.17 TRINITY_DN2041_c0_g1_i1:140-3268(+)
MSTEFRTPDALAYRASVIEWLTAACSADNVLRAEAERRLLAAAAAPDSSYGLRLAEIALDPSLAVPIRHLAALALKQYVKTHWSDADEAFVPPLVPPADKAAIRALLPAGLADPVSHLQTAVAMAIASIAHWDYPQQWPQLVQQLVHCLLNPQQAELVKGAIKCLEMFTDGDNLSDDQLPDLMALLLPVLLRIFNNEGNAYSDRVRMRALSIVEALTKWLGVLKGHHKQLVTKSFIQSALPGWMTGFAGVLSAPDTPGGDCGMKIHVCKIVFHLLIDFAAQVKPLLPGLMVPLWSCFSNGLSVYETVAVHDDLLDAAGQDSDGDVLGLPTLASMLLELMHCIVDSKHTRSVLKAQLAPLLYTTLGYVQMTADEEELWHTDPNQYVADEDDMGVYTVRSSAVSLILSVLEVSGAEAFKALAAAVARRLDEAAAARARGVPAWWKLREAVVMTLGAVSDELLERPDAFNVKAFVSTVLVDDINQPDQPHLKGRAMWAASRFSRAVPEASVPFVTAAVEALQAPQQSHPLPVKICACRAVASFCPRDPRLVAPFLPAIIAGVTSLVEQVSEDTLHLVLDTLLAVVNVDAGVAGQHEALLTPRLVAVWQRFHTDRLIVSAVEDVLSALAQNRQCTQAVAGRLLPVLHGLLSAEHEQSGLSLTALVLLRALVLGAAGGPGPLGQPLLATFGQLCSLLRQSDESAIIKEGVACLKAFVRGARDQLPLLQHRVADDGRTVDGLQLAALAAAHVVEPSVSDSASLYGGGLISCLISSYPQSIGSLIGPLLSAVLARLATAQLPSLIQSLVIVFARLVPSHAPEVLTFLASNTVNGINALPHVLGLWTRWHEDLHSPIDLKASVTGLAVLLRLPEPSLDAINVPGELIVDKKSERAVTRSMAGHSADRWTTVPLRVKILHILAREHQVAAEEQLLKASGAQAEDDGDDDDWEDDGDDDDDDDELDDLAQFAKAVGGPSPFVNASDLLDDDDDWADDQDDPDDPLHNVDVKALVEDCVRQMASADAAALTQLGQQLTAIDQQTLLAIVRPNS